MRLKTTLLLGAMTGLLICGIGAAAPVDHARIVGAENGGEWLSYGRTYAEQRFSPSRQIGTSTIGKLGVAWSAEFDTARGQEATPLVADGVLYTTTAWSKVYAFDAKNGKPLWAYDPQVPGVAGRSACCDVVNRGVALWGDSVFVGTIDGRLIALNAKTGKVKWSTQTTDPKLPYTITGAPRIAKGKVLIGNGGAEYGVRGYLSAYDADNGALSWRFYVTPNPEGKPDGAASDSAFAKLKIADTWFGDVWKTSGAGGTVWDAITYDPVADLVYIGTGNGSPWNHYIRSKGQGDNLFLSSIVAVKPETGEYVWHYQTTPGDSWDFTATQQIMVADLKIKGVDRHVVMQAPKNGFFYVLDARSGELLSADIFGPSTDWAYSVDMKTGRPVERPGVRWGAANTEIRMGPSPSGAHSWKPMSFDPGLGLVYIPTLDAKSVYGTGPNPQDYQHVDGVWNMGLGVQGIAPTGQAAPGAVELEAGRLKARAQTAPVAVPPPQSGGSLIAWDPIAGKTRWRVEHTERDWGLGGTLATGANLVFQGVKHDLKAYDGATGREVWSFALGASAIAPPISYEIGGVQYIALMVGIGGGNGMGGTNRLDVPQPGKLIVFKLGGSAKYAPTRVADRPAIDMRDAEPSKGDPFVGNVYYNRYCTVCHGAQAIFPDLRRSPMVLSKESFAAVVHGGALEANGMASFAKFLNQGQIEDVRAYLARPVP